jgi:hypothetical protein
LVRDLEVLCLVAMADGDDGKGVDVVTLATPLGCFGEVVGLADLSPRLLRGDCAGEASRLSKRLSERSERGDDGAKLAGAILNGSGGEAG